MEDASLLWEGGPENSKRIVGSGRIVASETKAPHRRANLVGSRCAVVQRANATAPRPPDLEAGERGHVDLEGRAVGVGALQRARR